MSKTILILFAVYLCTSATIVRRQTDDGNNEQDFAPISDWDPTIRDKTSSCQNMGSMASDSTQYCALFNMCCQMGFDPLNGDKCQQIDTTCEGPQAATCVFKNCTEMVTTTTTTLAPTTAAHINSASFLAGITSVGIALFFC